MRINIQGQEAFARPYILLLQFHLRNLEQHQHACYHMRPMQVQLKVCE